MWSSFKNLFTCLSSSEGPVSEEKGEKNEVSVEPEIELTQVLEPRLVTDVLPPELWDLVLNQIIDHESLVNCYETSPVWRDLLGHRKANILFPEVFPFIAKFLLNRKTTLKCRLVSPSWKAGVDAYVKKEALYSPDVNTDDDTSSFDLYHKSEKPSILRPLKILNSEGFRGFVENNHLQCLAQNFDPFKLSRACFIDKVTGSGGLLRLKRNFISKTILPKYGAQIHACDLLFYQGDPVPPTKVMNMIIQILSQLPNLTSLAINYYSFFNKCELKELDSVTKASVPQLDSLLHLRISELPPCLALLVSELLGKAKSITKVEVCHRVKSPDKKYDLIGNYPMLEQLSMNHGTFKLDNSPLKILSLETEITVQELAKVITPFKKTLQKLTVTLKKCKEGSPLVILDLPRLTALRVKTNYADFEWEVICGLTSLQNFKLRLINVHPKYRIVDEVHPDHFRRLHPMYYYSEKMKNSGIWAEMEDLHRVSIEVRIVPPAMYTQTPMSDLCFCFGQDWTEQTLKRVYNRKDYVK